MTSPRAGGWRERLGDERGAVSLWAIGATVACVLIVGLVLDGGAILRARGDAFGLAAAAARAGAQELDPSAAVDGSAVLDPVAAEQAALNYLAARGASGTVSVAGATITVTVTTTADLQMLGSAATVSATASVDAIKLDAP